MCNNKQTKVNMNCKHCSSQVAADEASNHPCFVGKEIYMDNENNLFVNCNEQVIVPEHKDKEGKCRNFFKTKILFHFLCNLKILKLFRVRFYFLLNSSVS